MRSEKKDIGKTSGQKVSSPEWETGRKGSQSGAPAEIGRYHMYGFNFARAKSYKQLKLCLLTVSLQSNRS